LPSPYFLVFREPLPCGPQLHPLTSQHSSSVLIAFFEFGWRPPHRGYLTSPRANRIPLPRYVAGPTPKTYPRTRSHVPPHWFIGWLLTHYVSPYRRWHFQPWHGVDLPLPTESLSPNIRTTLFFLRFLSDPFSTWRHLLFNRNTSGFSGTRKV